MDKGFKKWGNLKPFAEVVSVTSVNKGHEGCPFQRQVMRVPANAPGYDNAGMECFTVANGILFLHLDDDCTEVEVVYTTIHKKTGN